MIILNPVLGGKIRGVITTLFAVYVLAEQSFGFADETWAGWVTKGAAFAVAAIQILTHGTEVGNDAISGD